MKILFLTISVLTFYACRQREAMQQNETEKQNEFYQVIQNHFASLDSLLAIDANFAEAENVKLQKIISRYKEDIFTAKDTFSYHPLFVVKSPDNKLCLVSWNTRMGGTMIDFATMAIFKTTNGEIVSKMLLDSTDGAVENTLMHYDDLYQFQLGGQPIYIAYGFGQGSTALPWQELRAFAIKDSQLVSPLVFPESKPNLFVEFDTHQLRREEIPMIIVTDSGKVISSPIPNDEEGFSGKYQKLVFKDTVYTMP